MSRGWLGAWELLWCFGQVFEGGGAGGAGGEAVLTQGVGWGLVDDGAVGAEAVWAVVGLVH